uniref:F-box domain-containing protein n=1 Tax=Strongyloides papillosus TaxID=174720 RepID=A0A0N5CGU0_STREA
MTFRSVRDENSHVIQNRYNEKSAYFECDQDLSRFLKMSDMRDLDYLHVSGISDNMNIFGILNRSFQIGTKTGVLSISKLSNKDCPSFRTFIRKFLSVKEIVIRHICAPLMGSEDVCSLLSSLSSLNTIEYIKIFECHNTIILSADFVVNLLKNNPNIMYLDIGSSNIEFSESILKEFFTMEQPHIMENECNNNEITLALYFGGELKKIHDILRKDLSKIENVMKEVTSNVLFPEEYKVYVSKLDCKYCLKNRHKIMRRVVVQNYEDTCQRLDSLI